MLILLLLVAEENETQKPAKEFHFSVYKDDLYKAMYKYYKALYSLNNAFVGFFFGGCVCVCIILVGLVFLGWFVSDFFVYPTYK